MVKDIDLENTDLLDDLQTGECLTSDEAAEIIRKPARRDQIRKLILHLRRKSGKKFTVFLEKLQKTSNYPHIAKNLMESYNRKNTEFSKSTPDPRCLVCILKQDVLVKDVMDKIYSNGLVSTETFELTLDVVESDNGMIWDMILTQIKCSGDHRKARQVLQEALAKKYEHISARINTIRFPEMICRCRNSSQNLFVHASLKSDSTGSLGDISTTSTRKTYGTNVPEGQRSKGSLSIRSENSENSTNIDYTNIPSTVTWLESIPHDLSPNDDNEATSADNILADIVNDGVSVLSTDIDSVSRTGPLDDNMDENISNNTNVCQVKDMRNEDQTGSVQLNNESNTYPVSYASVVSRKSNNSKHVAKERIPIKNKCSTPEYSRMKSFSSGGSQHSKYLKGQKSIESLSEIGTMYLSKSQTENSSTVESRVQDNLPQAISKTFNKKQIKHSTPPIEQTDSKHCPMVLNSNSSVRIKSFEKVFFEEQKIIHGDFTKEKVKNTGTNHSNLDQAKHCLVTKHEENNASKCIKEPNTNAKKRERKKKKKHHK